MYYKMIFFPKTSNQNQSQNDLKSKKRSLLSSDFKSKS